MLKYLFFIALLLGGAWYGSTYMGISWYDVTSDLTALITDTLEKEYVWEVDSLTNHPAFSFDRPDNWEIDKTGNKATLTDPETGESVSIHVAEGEMITLDEAGEGKPEIVSGVEAIIVEPKDDKKSKKAYIPMPDNRTVVVEGNGNAFTKVYQHVDLTPNKPNWKIIGLEEPETERIMTVLDNYLEKMVPAEDKGKNWRSDTVVRVTEEPFAYIGYRSGSDARTLIVDVDNLDENNVPKTAGYYRYPLERYHGQWVVKGNNEPIAILPDASAGFTR